MPAPKLVAAPKPPAPSPNKIDTLFELVVGHGEVLLAVAVEIAHRY